MLSRLASEFRSRTPADFFAWLLSLVLRRQSHVLFRLSVDDLPPVAAPPDIEAVEINMRNFEELETLRSKVVALNAENAAYFDDVRHGKAFGLALVAGNEVIHYSFVFIRNKTACLLGLGADCALIGNAFTLPSHRGRGLQAYSARRRACMARDAGFDSIASETAPDNVASQRGLEKAGMKRAGRAELLVLLNCVVVRYQRPAGFRLLGLCL